MAILTKSADVQGMHLVGRDAVKLGVVRELFVDLETGRAEYLIVEATSLLGGSGKYQPVPWTIVRPDGVTGQFAVALTKDQFKAAPSYDRDQLNGAGYGWSEQASRYFSALDDAKTL